MAYHQPPLDRGFTPQQIGLIQNFAATNQYMYHFMDLYEYEEGSNGRQIKYQVAELLKIQINAGINDNISVCSFDLNSQRMTMRGNSPQAQQLRMNLGIPPVVAPNV